MDGLLEVSEARKQLLDVFSRVEKTHVPLSEAAGWVLAEEIISGIDIPPFANSSMDGFAILVDDVVGASPETPVTLKVVADVPAGMYLETPLKSGQAVRIMTGAPLPPGAEAVIPVEDTNFKFREPGVQVPPDVTLFRQALLGENVRPRGQDVLAGEMVIPANIRLRPQEVGFLAMLGIPEIPVYRQPRVAIFSTGDELLPVEAPLSPGTIHDSNAYILTALVARYGSVPINLGIAADKAESVEAILEQSILEKVDLIVSSAGVSVGAFDYVRTVIEEQGGLNFWRVNMRPGKPLAFGEYRKIPFIGLPGNPVSAFIGFEVFVRPALLKMAGLNKWNRPVRPVVLKEEVHSDGRESYLRAVVEEKNGHLEARLTGHQGSGNLRSLVQANALLIVPSGVKSLPIGAEAEAWVLDEPDPGEWPG